MSFRYEDVGYAIEHLKHMEGREPLTLSQDLCVYSQNVCTKDSPTILQVSDGKPLSADGKEV